MFEKKVTLNARDDFGDEVKRNAEQFEETFWQSWVENGGPVAL